MAPPARHHPIHLLAESHHRRCLRYRCHWMIQPLRALEPSSVDSASEQSANLLLSTRPPSQEPQAAGSNADIAGVQRILPHRWWFLIYLPIRGWLMFFIDHLLEDPLRPSSIPPSPSCPSASARIHYSHPLLHNSWLLGQSLLPWLHAMQGPCPGIVWLHACFFLFGQSRCLGVHPLSLKSSQRSEPLPGPLWGG